MKNSKAPGFDEITTEVIKAAGGMLEKIFRKVWLQEKSPKDWSRMLVNPIHIKETNLNQLNYRAISLLSIPGKIFKKYFSQECEIEPRRQQRGTADAIFIVRQIIEKEKERKVNIHFNFIDFKAVFDTIWRKAL